MIQLSSKYSKTILNYKTSLNLSDNHLKELILLLGKNQLIFEAMAKRLISFISVYKAKEQNKINTEQEKIDISKKC